jgi:hypothetical protein
MSHDEFMQYLPILQQGPFVLLPDPKGIDRGGNRFVYVDDNRTHVIIKSVSTDNQYHLPLALIQFVNPGVMRLAREVQVFNGSFV